MRGYRGLDRVNSGFHGFCVELKTLIRGVSTVFESEEEVQGKYSHPIEGHECEAIEDLTG